MGLQGFQSIYKPKRSGTVSFAELLDAVASVDPEMRIRFTSPHPKEFSDEVLQASLTKTIPLFVAQEALFTQSPPRRVCSPLQALHVQFCAQDLAFWVTAFIPTPDTLPVRQVIGITQAVHTCCGIC